MTFEVTTSYNSSSFYKNGCSYVVLSVKVKKNISGLDIGYVPAGPHAFFRSSGQFGPQQLILCWPPEAIGFQIGGKRMYQFFVTYRVPPCDGLTYKYFHPQSYSTCAY